MYSVGVSCRLVFPAKIWVRNLVILRNTEVRPALENERVASALGCLVKSMYSSDTGEII